MKPVKAYRNAREAFRVFNGWRKRRKAKREAKRQGIPFVDTQEDRPMLQGKKTYLGIATAIVGLVLGWFGIADEALSSNIVVSVNELITVAGTLFAAYGRAKAKPAS